VFVQRRHAPPEAAPAPGARRADEAGADGVLEHVVDGRRQVLVGLDDTRGEAVAEEVAGPAVLSVEALGVHPVESAQTVGELLSRARDDEVVVRRHETERDDVPPLLLHDLSEKGQEAATVVIVAIDGAAVDAADRDVVDAVGEEAARDPRHPTTVDASHPARRRVDTSARF
jgi:hypothetical protein